MQMSSIKTNAAAMTALQSLTQTNKMLTQTQNPTVRTSRTSFFTPLPL
jgi:hypothetical protein